MFASTLAWSFVYVSLPFHIQNLAGHDPAAALRWTGWILGVTSLVTVAMAPLWGRLASGGGAKRCYVAVECLQGLTFFLTAAARTLAELFLARFLLGFTGAASTFAFIIAGQGTGDVRRQVVHIQASMTVAQVIGPLAGAVAAARMGFRPSFLLAGALLLGCGLLVWRGVPDEPPAARRAERRAPASAAEVLRVSLIVLVASTHMFFLTAILPQVLPGLGIAREETLTAGGLLLFASGVATALGSLSAPRLADALGDRRAVAWLLALSSVLLAAHGLAGDVWTFGALRCAQSLVVAPVFPLVVAAVASRVSGQALGVINSSRIGASFLGPVVATNLLAWTPPAAVYAALAVPALLAVPLAWRLAQAPRSGPESAP
jgi:MFS family permease